MRQISRKRLINQTDQEGGAILSYPDLEDSNKDKILNGLNTSGQYVSQAREDKKAIMGVTLSNKTEVREFKGKHFAPKETEFVSNKNDLVSNMTELVLSMTGLVSNMTKLVSDMTGYNYPDPEQTKKENTISGLKASRQDVPQERENKQAFRGVPTSNATKAKEFKSMHFEPKKVKKEGGTSLFYQVVDERRNQNSTSSKEQRTTAQSTDFIKQESTTEKEPFVHLHIHLPKD